MKQATLQRDYKFLFYLGGITLAGFLLRLNHLGESITADEVSALLRLQFGSLGEMIEGGVRPDGHPAFTQVLLWFWIKVFGNSECAVRLPFVLMGTASIWLAGIATRRWFGTGAALAVAASLALLQFTIMYSQLARPYAPGLFFTMLAAYFISRFSESEKVKAVHVAGFAIAAAGAAYSHYFSLLTTLLLAVGGLFLVAKINRIKYFIACVIGVVLFLPHWGITLSQLKIGGVGGPGGWLGPPTPAFFKEHLFFIFNASRGLTLVVLFIALICLVFNKRRLDKKQIVVFAVWLIPLLTGYFYSIYVNPLLQHSVLLFSFPFLLMFIFSWFPSDENSKAPYFFANMLIAVMAWYITIHKPFRLTDHFGRLQEIIATCDETEQRYGAGATDAVFNVDDPYFLRYYLDRKNTLDNRVTFLVHDDARNEMAQLRYRVMHAQGNYFVYGWSTRESSPSALDIIAQEYPCLIEKHEWFNSAVYVFARSRVVAEECQYHSKMLFYSPMDIQPGSATPPVWKSSCGISGDTLTLDSACQYGPMLRVRVGDILTNPDNEIVLRASIFTPKLRTNCVMVVEYIRDGKSLLWTGMNTKSQLDTNRVGWQIAYFGQRPPIPLMKSDSIHAYLYTPELQEVHVRSLAFMTRVGHLGIYGARPDFE
ncbi:MAG TPA: glycosyltransferase family 39 protein [Bacteroidia bacterium]|nr:glycosyltransferase family 39 protein [Bacteroidia bacterium]